MAGNTIPWPTAQSRWGLSQKGLMVWLLSIGENDNKMYKTFTQCLELHRQRYPHFVLRHTDTFKWKGATGPPKDENTTQPEEWAWFLCWKKLDTKLDSRAQRRGWAKYLKQQFQRSEWCPNRCLLPSFKAGGLVTWFWLCFKITMKQCLLCAFWFPPFFFFQYKSVHCRYPFPTFNELNSDPSKCRSTS